MEGTNGKRIHFSVLATTTPKLLIGGGSRQAVTFTSTVDVYLGYSGTSSSGMLLGAGKTSYDLFSSDEWWATTPSSSGTVSGFIVI
jgi:hypothetical protein